MSFGVHLGQGSAFKTAFDSKTLAILDRKWIPNQSKSIKNQKSIESKTNDEFDTIVWSIWDQILINFEAKMKSKFDQILG